MFIVFVEYDFTEFGDVENDKRLLVLTPLDALVVGWVGKNAVKM